METALVIVLALFAIAALLVWWLYDIDVADIVATVGAPLAGASLIYWYGTPAAWAAGLVLVSIGGFGLYYWLTRKSRRAR